MYKNRGHFRGRKKTEKNWGAMVAPYLGRRGRPSRSGSLAYAALGGDKKLKKENLGCLRHPKFRAPPAPLSGGACGATNGFKNVTRSIGIPNMCLVLKSDNGKVVFIANRQIESQNHGITEPSIPYYYIDCILHILY